jgi:hypothetical protein
MQWSEAILDKYVAPGITVFTSADIPDLQPEFLEWRHWIANYFLNNVLRGAFREPWRQYALNFIRRAQASFKFYHLAREATLNYLADNEPLNPKVGQYYETIYKEAAINELPCSLCRLVGDLRMVLYTGSCVEWNAL